MRRGRRRGCQAARQSRVGTADSRRGVACVGTPFRESLTASRRLLDSVRPSNAEVFSWWTPNGNSIMTSLRRETRWLARGLIINGAMTLLLAFTALALTEATLIGAMLIVGLLSLMFGFNQVLTATAIRNRTPHWRLVLGHGLLSIAFGLLTVGGTALPFTVLLGCVLGWLAGHAALAGRTAGKGMTGSIRRGLIASAIVDGAVAVLAIVLRPLTIFQFLFFGAAYAALFGVTQILAGLFLRTARLDRTHDFNAHGPSHAIPA
jgi:hypothetical protein